MITVRKAVYEDVAAMLQIYNDIILNTKAVWQEEQHTLVMRQEWFKERVGSGFPIFVAELNGRVTGFSTYGSFRYAYGYRFTVENSVYVASSSRGMGIANLLMPPIIEAAKLNGIHVMLAGIEASNKASINLHEKFGFAEAAHFKQIGFKFGDWLDLKFFQLIITPQ